MGTDLLSRCCVLRRKTLCVYLLAVCTLLTCVLLFTKTTELGAFRFRHFLTSSLRRPADDVTPTSSDVTRARRRCKNVFPGMLHGRWAPKRNVSEARRREMDEFLVQMRGELRIPRSLQRDNGKCGNLPYDGVPQYTHMWFRALCDPRGPTPCCYRFRCSNRSLGQCRCPSCLDPRTPVHAELSDWRPARAECRPRSEFGAREACEVLNGTTLILAGDSFVRHVFVALVMLLTDDFQEGALRKDAPPGTRRYCRGMVQINGLRCRSILDEDRRTLCNGTVRATYLEIFPVSKGRFLLPHLQRQAGDSTPRARKKVLLLVGLGIHDQFRADIVWPMFLRPLAEYVSTISIPSAANVSIPFVRFEKNPYGVQPQQVIPAVPDFYPTNRKSARPAASRRGRRRRKWPKMIWLNAHAPGLLKSPKFQFQSFQGVQFYNAVISRLLEPYGIPVLDSFNMTAPLHAVDGTHYSYGANHMKVQFLLNWVQERQDRGEW